MKKDMVKIMVFGTFDVLHPGHLHFFKQAKRLAQGSFLIVSIARDINVQRIKGKKPLHNEKQRAALVLHSGIADKVVLGGRSNHVPHILKEQPDIICLGYDQTEYVSSLSKLLPQVKVVRLKPHKPLVYKSSIIKKKTYGRHVLGRTPRTK